MGEGTRCQDRPAGAPPRAFAHHLSSRTVPCALQPRLRCRPERHAHRPCCRPAPVPNLTWPGPAGPLSQLMNSGNFRIFANVGPGFICGKLPKLMADPGTDGGACAAPPACSPCAANRVSRDASCRHMSAGLAADRRAERLACSALRPQHCCLWCQWQPLLAALCRCVPFVALPQLQPSQQVHQAACLLMTHGAAKRCCRGWSFTAWPALPGRWRRCPGLVPQTCAKSGPAHPLSCSVRCTARCWQSLHVPLLLHQHMKQAPGRESHTPARLPAPPVGIQDVALPLLHRIPQCVHCPRGPAAGSRQVAHALSALYIRACPARVTLPCLALCRIAAPASPKLSLPLQTASVLRRPLHQWSVEILANLQTERAEHGSVRGRQDGAGT